MKFFFAAILSLIGSFPAQATNLRLIPPTKADLAGFQLSPGEIALDPSLGQLVRRQDSAWVAIGHGVKQERLPGMTKMGASEIVIFPGRVLIGEAFYENAEILTCSFSVIGPGGYDEAPANDPETEGVLTYMYLVPAAKKKVGEEYDCLMSESATPPTQSRFIGSFWSKYPFVYDNGQLYAATTEQVSLPLGNHTACTRLDVSDVVGLTARKAAFAHECVGTEASNNSDLYKDSACTVSYTGSPCTSGPNFYFPFEAVNDGNGLNIFYKGNVTKSHWIRAIEVTEELRR